MLLLEVRIISKGTLQNQMNLKDKQIIKSYEDSDIASSLLSKLQYYRGI